MSFINMFTILIFFILGIALLPAAQKHSAGETVSYSPEHKYCFFISNSRLDYFNIEKIIEEIDEPITFVLIHTKRSAHKVSPRFKTCMQHVFDVENIDFDTCKPILESFLDKNSSASIVCTDEPFLVTAAELREHFDIPGARTYQFIPFNSKITMKQILSIRNIRVPKFLSFEIQSAEKNLEEYHQFLFELFNGPYVVKPVNCGGCELTAKVTCLEDLLHWYKNFYEPTFTYDVEEFIEGDFYHCDSFVVDNKIQWCTTSKYVAPMLEFVSGKAMGSYPLDKSLPLYDKIMDFNKRVLEAFSPPNGTTHLEFFVKGDELIFIEIGARPPGQAVCLVYEKNFNVNFYELSLRNELQMPLNIDVRDDNYHAWFVLSTRPGTVQKLNIPLLKSEVHLKWKIQEGDVITHYPRSLNEGASVEALIYNPNYQELLDDFAIIYEHSPYETSKDPS